MLVFRIEWAKAAFLLIFGSFASIVAGFVFRLALHWKMWNPIWLLCRSFAFYGTVCHKAYGFVFLLVMV